MVAVAASVGPTTLLLALELKLELELDVRKQADSPRASRCGLKG